MSSGNRGYSGAVVDTLTEEAHRSLLATFSPRTAASNKRHQNSTARPGDLFRTAKEELSDWVEVEQEKDAKAKQPSKLKTFLKGW